MLPYSKAVIDGITPGIPVIHFSTGTAGLLKQIRAAGGDVIGLDWRVNLDEAWKTVGHDIAIQGNLDPVALFASPKDIKARAGEILLTAAAFAAVPEEASKAKKTSLVMFPARLGLKAPALAWPKAAHGLQRCEAGPKP